MSKLFFSNLRQKIAKVQDFWAFGISITNVKKSSYFLHGHFPGSMTLENSTWIRIHLKLD
jgi:hypothetical protein